MILNNWEWQPSFYYILVTDPEFLVGEEGGAKPKKGSPSLQFSWVMRK